MDRKIIIENENFYCVSIDPVYQIGTLHAGTINDTLLSAEKLALPAGRNLGGNENQLCWDIQNGKNIYAISTLEHPLNDRYEAIKKISVDSLKPWAAYQHFGEVILQSVDNHMYSPNEPYKYISTRFQLLDTYFFDAIFYDNKFWMVVNCQDEWTVWHFTDYEWKQSSVMLPYTSCKFSLFSTSKGMHMVLENSAVYSVSEKKIELVQLANAKMSLNDGVIIENRDRGIIQYLDNTHIDKQKPFNEVITEFATILYE